MWLLLDRPNASIAGLPAGSIWRALGFMLITRLLVCACSILLHALAFRMGALDSRHLGFSVTGELVRILLPSLIVTATSFVALRGFARVVGVERSRAQTLRAVFYISAYELLTISVMPLFWVGFLYTRGQLTGMPYALLGTTFYIPLALRYSFPLVGGHLGLLGARRAIAAGSLVFCLLLFPAILTGANLAHGATWPTPDKVVEILFGAVTGLLTQVPIPGWNL